MSISSTSSKSINKNFKKGFTLIEIIIVVVIIGILVSLFYPSIMSNKDKAIINSTVGNDVKLLSGAITEWKTTSPDSNGSYSSLTTDKIVPYLPSSMTYDGTSIHSSGLNGGIAYQIESDKINTNGDSFKVYSDFTAAITNNNYDDRIKTYAETVAMDKWKKLSTDKTAGDTTVVGDATAIGSANDVFTTGGTTKDGKSGTRKIVF